MTQAKVNSIISRLRETQLKEIVILIQNNANKLVLEFKEKKIKESRRVYFLQMSSRSLMILLVTRTTGPECY